MIVVDMKWIPDERELENLERGRGRGIFEDSAREGK